MMRYVRSFCAILMIVIAMLWSVSAHALSEMCNFSYATDMDQDGLIAELVDNDKDGYFVCEEAGVPQYRNPGWADFFNTNFLLLQAHPTRWVAWLHTLPLVYPPHVMGINAYDYYVVTWWANPAMPGVPVLIVDSFLGDCDDNDPGRFPFNIDPAGDGVDSNCEPTDDLCYWPGGHPGAGPYTCP